MEDFKTLEGVTELFKKVNCIGNENCFFMAFKDTNREGMKYGVQGAIGGIVGGAIATALDEKVISFSSGMEQWIDGMLINQTENGLGMIPLASKGVRMFLTPEKLETRIENFVFLDNKDVEEIKVKDFNIFNKKVQTLKIKINSGNTLHLLVNVKEKLIPYQEENFAKFMNKYKK